MHIEDVLARGDANTVAVHFTATGAPALSWHSHGLTFVCVMRFSPPVEAWRCVGASAPRLLQLDCAAAGCGVKAVGWPTCTACGAGTNTGVWRGSEPSGKRTIFSGVRAGVRWFAYPG